LNRSAWCVAWNVRNDLRRLAERAGAGRREFEGLRNLRLARLDGRALRAVLLRAALDGRGLRVALHARALGGALHAGRRGATLRPGGAALLRSGTALAGRLCARLGFGLCLGLRLRLRLRLCGLRGLLLTERLDLAHGPAAVDGPVAVLREEGAEEVDEVLLALQAGDLLGGAEAAGD